jgi:hypothetical protein
MRLAAAFGLSASDRAAIANSGRARRSVRGSLPQFRQRPSLGLDRLRGLAFLRQPLLASSESNLPIEFHDSCCVDHGGPFCDLHRVLQLVCDRGDEPVLDGVLRIDPDTDVSLLLRPAH